MRVYLAGAINGCSDNEAKDWRSVAKDLMPYEMVDPMSRDYRGREMDDGIAKDIVESDKADILTCHAVLVHYDKPSVGTAMEVLFAWENDLPVVIFCKEGTILSPWMIYHADVIVNTWQEVQTYFRHRHIYHRSTG